MGKTYIEISMKGYCDYCDEPITFAGADPVLQIIRRACPEHVHVANVQLKSDEWNRPPRNHVKGEK